MSPKTGKIRKKSLYITISEKTEMIIDRMCQQATIWMFLSVNCSQKCQLNAKNCNLLVKKDVLHCDAFWQFFTKMRFPRKISTNLHPVCCFRLIRAWRIWIIWFQMAERFTSTKCPPGPLWIPTVGPHYPQLPPLVTRGPPRGGNPQLPPIGWDLLKMVKFQPRIEYFSVKTRKIFACGAHTHSKLAKLHIEV